MFFQRIYDENLAAASYLIGCQQTGEAILVDPQRDIDRYILLAAKEGLRITCAAETHIHADFLSGAREVAEQLDATIYLSDEGGPDWTYQWLNKKSSGGTYKIVLVKDGDIFTVGKIEFQVMHTPGHTPEHISFLITDRGSGASQPIGIASGDFLFVGDLGRPDLLETAAGKVGAAATSAHSLYQSIRKLKQLPEFLQVWPAHGSGSACGKALGAIPMSTIGYETRFNPALLSATSEDAFVTYILADQPEPPLYFSRMKKENRLGPKILGSLPTPKNLDIAELKKIDAKNELLIDTRSWPEFRSGHIAGSLFHPFNRNFVTDIGAMALESTNIYLICTATQLNEIIRNLIRIGLDTIKGWIDPTSLSEYIKTGGKLVTTKEESPEEIQKLIKSDAVHLLDVRGQSEYKTGHIQGAQNIAHTRIGAKLSELPKDKPLVVHCQSGTRASYTCALLQRAGFDVINLRGGIVEWKKAGLTLL